MQAVPEQIEALVDPAILRQREEGLKSQTERLLTQVAARLGGEYPNAPHQVEARIGPPAESIAAAADVCQASLVVMSTHGRTGVSRLLLGSVAGAVLRDSTVPLLLVRPSAVGPASTLPVLEVGDEVAPGPAVSLSLRQDEIALLRTALETLAQTVTRHQQLHGRIHRLLARLPTSEIATSVRR